MAAGRGVRMRSTLPKVLHPLAGVPLLGHVLAAARQLTPLRLVCVTGQQSQPIQAAFPEADITWIHQSEQLGTAHAVQCALPALGDITDPLLILSGDTPLVSKATLDAVINHHQRQGSDVTVVSTSINPAKGYGRIVRDAGGQLLRVVEEKDANAEERAITEVNSGIYCVNPTKLTSWLERISANNAQKEYYLPDIVAIAISDNPESVGIYHHDDAPSLAGVNNRRQLAEMEATLRDRLVGHWQDEGVTFLDPSSCWLAMDVTIGQDSVIQPSVVLGAGTTIGKNCQVGPFCEIQRSHIGDGCEIKGFCHIENAKIEGGNQIGPYARLRPGAVLAEEAKVGNFCEIKKSYIGRGSKVNHLSYIGDTTVGSGVNIGAGSITCNYDGVHKHKTTIGDGVFIGSDSQIVAPVQIGDRAVIAAGTTVTKDVAADALAIARTAQKQIADWSKRKK